MGSGSSRSGRALRRLRGPDSRPAGPGGAASEGGTGPRASAKATAWEEAPEAAGVEAGGAADPDPEPDHGPVAASDGRDETLRLLDQLLKESAAWGSGEAALRGPARPQPIAAGTGSRVSPKQSAEYHPESSSVCVSNLFRKTHVKLPGRLQWRTTGPETRPSARPCAAVSPAPGAVGIGWVTD
ncbi:cystin-1 isoform X1 [Saccopteryx leptura]|uniref:cystin-1 isoform X1 n=1 Tax=Saccopteryx leptura TaxID=249018 RepID=UPI00339C0AE0